MPAATLPVSARWYEGAEGLRRAQDEQRRTRAPMLVYFRVDWCPFCQRMDRLVLPAPAVTRFLASDKVEVNPERSPQDRALALNYGADRYPSVFLIPARTPGRRRSRRSAVRASASR